VFGGVSPDEVIMAYIGLLGLMLFCCGVGLYASTLCQRSHVALISTYVIVGVFLLVAYDHWDFTDAVARWTSFGAGTFVFTLSVLTCKRLLPRVAQRERRSWVRRLFNRLSAFFHRINFTGVVVFDESRALKGNAMLWKETHNRLFSSTTFLIRSFYAMILVSMVVFALLVGLNIRLVTVAVVIVSGGLIVLCVVAIVASSTAFAGEREKHSLDVLLSTPVAAKDVVAAKFIGVMRLMAPLMIIIMLWFLVGDAMHEDWRQAFDTLLLVRVLFVCVGYLPLLAVLGLNASASRRGTGAALLQTVIICLAWCVLPLLVSPFLPSLPRLLFGVDYYGWGEWASYLSPIADMDPDHYDHWPWTGILAIPAWMTLLWILVRRFDRIMGRV
jgi:ABC-type transport system involved in multi-copper enzyme maturation permease subunit